MKLPFERQMRKMLTHRRRCHVACINFSLNGLFEYLRNVKIDECIDILDLIFYKRGNTDLSHFQLTTHFRRKNMDFM